MVSWRNHQVHDELTWLPLQKRQVFQSDLITSDRSISVNHLGSLQLAIKIVAIIVLNAQVFKIRLK